MSYVITAGGGGNTPIVPVTGPIVYTANTFPDPQADPPVTWNFDPTLDVIEFSMHASSSAASTASLRHRYGNEKRPYESDFSTKSRRPLMGTWVKITLLDDQGNENTQFVGQFRDVSTELMGNSALAAGIETWVAYGGHKILERITLTQAYFLDSNANAQLVDWVPGMNKRDKKGLLVGNRSVETGSGDGTPATYFFGGEPGSGASSGQLWTHGQFLDYLVANFIQQQAPDAEGVPAAVAPYWTVGGQRDVLDNMTTTVDIPHGATLAEILKLIIPVKYGVDFFIVPTDGDENGAGAGYEIRIFALLDEAFTIQGTGGGVDMPANPNTIQVDRTDKKTLMQTQIVTSGLRQVDAIRVEGKRITVCGTLYGQRSADFSGQPAGLVPKWSPDLEAEYVSAAGMSSSDYDTVSLIRLREKYRSVYAAFGAPLDWDIIGAGWALSVTSDGFVNVATDTSAGGVQTSARETLPQLPLRLGFDYTTWPPTDNTNPGTEASFLEPLVFVLDENPRFLTPAGEVYLACDTVRIHAHHLEMDFGIVLSAPDNATLAYGHLSDETLATFGASDSMQIGRFDYETLVATVAIPSDRRIALQFDVPPALAQGDGSVMTIVDEEAETWVLLPNTVVGVDASGNLQFSGSTLRLVRDDSQRLALAMAGALSRYVVERTRAIYRFKALLSWMSLLGFIMTVTQQGDDAMRVGSPITSIEWKCGAPAMGMAGSPETIVKAGYA